MTCSARIPGQASLDDLGIPLTDVTFCIVDLETTGISVATSAITEIGAVKLRGGECVGTFQTLIDPGAEIPRSITVLTGITNTMVVDAPPISAVLPSFLEFLGDAVIVGHNVRFDLSFLRAAVERSGRPPMTNRSVDTCGLARRLLRDEVPNCKLSTLANYLQFEHQPSHRALDDALATGDLLHLLLDRAGGLGVTGLEDLLLLPQMAGHAQAAKLQLTENLPRQPGVYLFRNSQGEVLYVGRANNLRSRVRSYFSSDTRKKIAQLLEKTVRIDHQICQSLLEAAVTEIRLIHQYEPRFNQQGTTWRRYAYVKLSLDEPYPRLSATRVADSDGSLYLGPVSSTAAARRIIKTIETVMPLRRCASQPGKGLRSGSCLPVQIGATACPCISNVSEKQYAAVVDTTVQAVNEIPELLLTPLAERMTQLAGERRFEEAAEIRDQAKELATVLDRRNRIDRLRRSGRLCLAVGGASILEFHDGRLAEVKSFTAPNTTHPISLEFPPADNQKMFVELAQSLPVVKEQADELHCVASWLQREAHRLVVRHCDGTLAEPIRQTPMFRTESTHRQRR
ncbi:MAG: DEDD exonuclease domain-containing protein [Acidimicrobiales bacterium]|nr:DEDD exonuclease domain-containing protein [Acidimicrobiales bacterium]